MAILRERTGSR